MDKESLSSLKDCVSGVSVAPKNVNFLRTDPEILGPIDFMISWEFDLIQSLSVVLLGPQKNWSPERTPDASAAPAWSLQELPFWLPLNTTRMLPATSYRPVFLGAQQLPSAKSTKSEWYPALQMQVFSKRCSYAIGVSHWKQPCSVGVPRPKDAPEPWLCPSTTNDFPLKNPLQRFAASVCMFMVIHGYTSSWCWQLLIIVDPCHLRTAWITGNIFWCHMVSICCHAICVWDYEGETR